MPENETVKPERKKRDSKRLTPYQQRYLKNYFGNGMNRNEAMKATNPKLSGNSLSVCSTEMHNRAAVQAFLQKHMQQYLEKDFSDLYNVKVCTLIAVMINSYEEGDYRCTVAAINELNKMSGDHAPEKKISITVDGDQIQRLKDLYEKAKRDY